MTATSTARRPSRRSAFPPDVSALMSDARKAVDELAAEGRQPSQRALAAMLHVGKPKAAAVLDALAAEADRQPPTRPLHLVPADAPTAEPEPAAADGSHLDEGGAAGDGSTAALPAGDATDLDDNVPPVPPVSPAPTVQPSPHPVPVEADQADPEPNAPEPSGPDAPRRVPVWPVLLLTLPAMVAIWSGWVGLGGMAGFGIVHPLPGIADHLTLNTAITLPIGVEVYAAYALWVWLSRGVPAMARRFARTSAIASLVTGAAGQVTYHLLSASHVQHAPWPVTILVACLPVAVLGMGAALAHLVRGGHH